MNHTTPAHENQPQENQPPEDEPGEGTPGEIALSPFYHSSVNEITRPESYTACSHYLTRRWKRDLGPTGYAILTSFRDRCFSNRKTKELRDVIQVTMSAIADECGISEKTVRRELAANKALQRFIRAQREPVPDVRRGGWHWGPNTFQVAMDDPVHPDDEAQLLEIVRRKAVEADKAPEDPLIRARRLTNTSPQTTPREQKLGQKSTLGQFDRAQTGASTQRSDKLTERRDKLTGQPDKLTTTPGQIDRTLKSPDSSLPENTFPDAAGAAPEVFASLFEEQDRTEEEGRGPAVPSSSPQRWEDLSEAERAPWLEQAETQLRENFGMANWMKMKDRARGSVRTARAAILYAARKKDETVQKGSSNQ